VTKVFKEIHAIIHGFDFQDSEVSTTELRDDQFIIRFAAAHIHRENTDGNIDDSPGFIQSLELTLNQATIIEHDLGCVGRLSQGTLRVVGATIKSVPIPYEAEADIELELAFSNGSTCKVTGERIVIKQNGEARVMEWLKC